MQAHLEDLEKVIQVTREQVNISLKQNPISLYEFKKGLVSFEEVSKKWQTAIKNKSYDYVTSVQELRESMKKEVLELIKSQRLACMVQGDRFHKVKQDRHDKNRFVYCMLSPNHKNLYFGDWPSDKETPTLEQLKSKDRWIAISDIDAVSVREVSEKPSSESGCIRVLTIHYNGSSQPLELLQSDLRVPADQKNTREVETKTLDFWWDGLNCLIHGKSVKYMESRQVDDQLKTLLDLKIKLKLLHLNGMDIPVKPPPIPTLPTNYNFYHQYN